MIALASRPPRPRTLVHPGRFNPVRIQMGQAASARHIRLALQPGLSLFAALVEPLAAAGVTSASTTILGGFFDRLDYCVAPPDPAGRAVIAYTDPIPAGAAHMIFGNATLGLALDGRPLVHCHATLRSAAGAVKGGHILTETSIIGPTPIPVLVTAFEGFVLKQAYDAETNIPLLQPETAPP